ncbi:hypothetical protein N7478_010677 [Penicillium angulare]|uniref:uncharacterized protein n=1 Tax=Penicillium angulare TaxID=116970 RepID=UPI00253FAC11|nr:uncharacterized protein N7478_010677 [Penicillium angulare]KAJ5267869.1 hypothetical protein N7478_010677 [Penicillium angulare]
MIFPRLHHWTTESLWRGEPPWHIRVDKDTPQYSKERGAITEKRSQRNQQAHENEFYRTCCANFCYLATAVVDIIQKLVLEEYFHSDQFMSVNARLCRATLALWAALDASRVEEDRAERIWMQELDMPTPSKPSSEWI